MVIESLDIIINTIFYYLQAFTKPENLLLIILIVATVVIPLLVYYFHRRHIPKLVFDGIWKEPNCKGNSTCYYIKVKRDKGEGKAEVVEGFVGIKGKELKPSEWLKSKSEIANIMNHDYLLIFETFYDKGNEIISFPENIFAEYHQSYENNLFNQYKEKTLEVQIDATRGRISKRQFKKKIKKIVKEAKPISM